MHGKIKMAEYSRMISVHPYTPIRSAVGLSIILIVIIYPKLPFTDCGIHLLLGILKMVGICMLYSRY